MADTIFPSKADYDRICAEVRALRSSKLSSEDKWRHLSYHYAFLRIFHKHTENRCNLDPSGQWYSTTYVKQAEEFFRRLYNKPKTSMLTVPARSPQLFQD